VLAAHRFAWEMVYGLVPPGLEVCHRCDNPPCCHVVLIPELEQVPDHPSGLWTNRDGRAGHLWLGTHAENMADMGAKGRAPYPSARLTRERAAEIRQRRQAGERGIDLAGEFDISQQEVCNILKGRTWL
jgi:hypothetical protein